MPEPENTQIHIFAYFMCFLVWALPEVWDQIQKQFFFLIKCYIFTVLNFFVERLVPKYGVPKNEFPTVFSKSDLGRGGDG